MAEVVSTWSKAGVGGAGRAGPSSLFQKKLVQWREPAPDWAASVKRARAGAYAGMCLLVPNRAEKQDRL